MSVEIGYHVQSDTCEADITTAAIQVWEYGKLSVQIASTGGTTHAGPIYLQVSNDGSAWETAITLTTVSAGAAIDVFYDNVETAARYLRFFFDRTTGAAGETITFTLAARAAA